MITDAEQRQRTACEATQLLNEAVRQLTIPSIIIEDSKEQPNFLRVAAIRNLCLMSIVVNLYRVKEIQDHFLAEFLFTPEELRQLGFPSIEDFIGGPEKMKWLEILRSQFAGHAHAVWYGNNKPGKIIPPKLLGQALRETGLTDLPGFASRLRDEFAVMLETFIQKLRQIFPVVDKYVRQDYPLELERGRLGQ
jgi:hypothetical protein